MENATKALLIAGSVLVAILLIAMGLRIFNSTSGTTEQSQKVMDTTAITTFNSQFDAGFSVSSKGTMSRKVTGVQANALIQKVNASYAVNKEHMINISIGAIGGPINNNGNYTALLLDNNNDGYYDYLVFTP